MNICEKTSLPYTDTASAIAGKLFESIGHCIPLVVIAGQDKSCHASDNSVFAEVFTNSDDISNLCCRIADGQDILTTQQNGYTILASQINSSEPAYAIIAVSGQPSDTVYDLSEVIFAQIDILAGVIEDQISHLLEPIEVLGNSFICN